VGQYVEFTGILIDISAGTAVPVLSVDPGEILYIGDIPPEAMLPEDDDPSDAEVRFR
jgi:hypothetical protein